MGRGRTEFTMDIRVEKTQKAIKQAYIELRSQKPLEKITVKELCQLACINKSTFYSHYADIYELSDVVEQEIVNSVLDDLSSSVENVAKSPEVFTREVYLAFVSRLSLINTLFPGTEQRRLVDRLEIGIKELIARQNPEFGMDVEKGILLSFSTQGAFYAYLNNRDVDRDILIRTIENIIKRLQPLY